MTQQGYDIEYIFSDNGSMVVVYKRIYIAQDSEEETTEGIAESDTEEE